MTHASLFSGIGGFDIAAEWAGWDNVFNCEIADFPRKVLNYHFPNAVQYDDIKSTDFTVWRGRVDVLTGGFPCQPFSTAGKRKGTEDNRYLWPEMLRAIREIRPRWVVGENVLGIVNWNRGMVFEQVHVDLEAEGYESQTFVLPACSVGAPHQRYRTWFVAHAIENAERDGRESRESEKEGTEVRQFGDISTGGSDRIYIQKRSIAHGADAGVESKRERQDCIYAPRTTPNSDSKRRQEFVSPTMPGQETFWAREICNTNKPGTVTHSDSERRYMSPGADISVKSSRRTDNGQQEVRRKQTEWDNGLSDVSRHFTDTESERLSERHGKSSGQQAHATTERCYGLSCWENFPTQSPVCSRDDGFPIPMDGIAFPKWRSEAIKAYGNAIVPQVAYRIFDTINKYERQ